MVAMIATWLWLLELLLLMGFPVGAAAAGVRGRVPAMRGQPVVHLAAAEAPVLADLQRRQPPVLRQRVEGRLGDL